MTLDPARVSALVSQLQVLHGKYDSWRTVQELHYPTVPAGTLNTIVNSGGEKIPKKHWRALGLLEPRRKATEYRSVTEAYCERCDKIWSGKTAHRDGREHAEQHCHRVRVVQTVVRVYEVK